MWHVSNQEIKSLLGNKIHQNKTKGQQHGIPLSISDEMSVVGCAHLQSYKKTNKNKNTFKWIHAVFVVNSTAKSLKTKVNPNFNSFQ